MIISSKNDLLKEIDSMLNSQNICNITLLYPHINANLTYAIPQNLEQKILSKLRQIKHNTTIHSFESQILQQPHIHSKHITIRRLLQCLNIIGQNNIVALYVGTNSDRGESQQDKKRPKLIGRLATAIIIGDRF